MRFVKNKKLYIPALTLIAVVLLLIVLIAFSTFRTLNHQKETALAFLHSQGVTLFHALEAAVSTGMRMPMWSEDSAKTLINEFGKNRNLAYIYIYEKNGIISHASNVSMVAKPTDWPLNLQNSNRVASRLRKLDDGSQVYELAKLFSPLSNETEDRMHHMPNHGAYGSFLNHHAGATVVLGLSMEQFETVHRSDLQHAITMGITLLLLGSGAFFFIFVIQNYYLVDRALEKSRDYLKLVMASMSNGMLSIDAAGDIITINKSACNLLGIKEKDIGRIDLRSMIDFQSSGINKTLTDGTAIADQEIVYEKPTGQLILSISVSPIVDEDKKSPFTGAVIMLRDLTEIKRLQEKVRRNEKLAAIGELAAGIAHEVRNPLSSIRGFAQFLKRVLKDRPKESEYADLMVKEVDRINNVVTNLLSFARPAHLEPAPTDISEFLHHTIRLVQEDAKLRKINIHLKISQAIGKVILDGNQMTQVMLNLVLNALQAVDIGGHIWVTAERLDSRFLQISVEDDGPGIPPDRVKHIFDPFFTTKEKGTGLGMSIVQMIVENHGGEIRVSSPVPGKINGCRISLQLPAAVDTIDRPSKQTSAQ